MKKQSIILAGLLLLALVLAGCTLGGQGGGPTATTSPTHLECKNSQCTRVPGGGLDRCRTNADCNVTHKECRNLACVPISGPGKDLCRSNADCNITHLECRNLQCVSIQGQGQNLCQTNFDCNSHLTCQGLSCIRIAGYGQDLCQSNADCNVSDQNHLDCVNQQCVLVPGGGQDLCQSNADCNATHLECSNLQCISVQGQGQNLCQTNADCNASGGVDLIVNSIPRTFGPDSNSTYWLDFNVVIQNIGNQAYSGPVSLAGTKHWDGNSSGITPFSTVCTVSLPPMATANCYHNLSYSNPPANYTIWALADSNHLILELNENNNDKNVTFHIP